MKDGQTDLQRTLLTMARFQSIASCYHRFLPIRGSLRDVFGSPRKLGKRQRNTVLDTHLPSSLFRAIAGLTVTSETGKARSPFSNALMS